ncbi:tetratricopeptide repeat protein [Luteimonas sp. Y-2-2-4F]|nr:type VI secretion system accessory protein TagJ [Luteimonas sp. Y-2-2-4F]MCD9033588.1 tetratricopeptide repeat protein [Luteimonas sp. Y-2-2-4F]
MPTVTATHGAGDASPAEALLRAGRLDAALEALSAQVRSAPADAQARVFLFQLLAAAGQWERAARQLDAAQRLDPDNATLAVVYAALLAAERVRAEVFAGARLPTVVGDPEPWLAPLLQAARLDAQGLHAPAATLRAQAFEHAPAVAGRLDGAPFAWLADADPRFGPCLELVVDGGYAWAPFARIRALRFEPPTALCDTLWMPVAVTWTEGGESPAFVPARYPGSESAGDDALRLGRRTEWSQRGEETWLGLGQRMLATDAGERALLDVRAVEFDEA